MLVISKKIGFDDDGMPLFGMFEPDTDGWDLWFKDRRLRIQRLVYRGYYIDCRTIQLECIQKNPLEIGEYIKSYQSQTETKPQGVIRRLWQWS